MVPQLTPTDEGLLRRRVVADLAAGRPPPEFSAASLLADVGLSESGNGRAQASVDTGYTFDAWLEDEGRSARVGDMLDDVFASEEFGASKEAQLAPPPERKPPALPSIPEGQGPTVERDDVVPPGFYAPQRGAVPRGLPRVWERVVPAGPTDSTAYSGMQQFYAQYAEQLGERVEKATMEEATPQERMRLGDFFVQPFEEWGWRLGEFIWLDPEARREEQRIVDLEVRCRLQNGLYDPKEVYVPGHNPMNAQGRMRADVQRLRRTIQKQFRLGLPMVDPAARAGQEILYRHLAPKQIRIEPRTFLEHAADIAGGLTGFVIPIALTGGGAAALGAGTAVRTAAEVGVAGVYGALGAPRGERVSGGVQAAGMIGLFRGLGAVGRAAGGKVGAALGREAVGRTAGGLAAEAGTFGGLEAAGGAPPERIAAATILGPLIFRLPHLIATGATEFAPKAIQSLRKSAAYADRQLAEIIKKAKAGGDVTKETEHFLERLVKGQISLGPGGRKAWQKLTKDPGDVAREGATEARVAEVEAGLAKMRAELETVDPRRLPALQGRIREDQGVVEHLKAELERYHAVKARVQQEGREPEHPRVEEERPPAEAGRGRRVEPSEEVVPREVSREAVEKVRPVEEAKPEPQEVAPEVQGAAANILLLKKQIKEAEASGDTRWAGLLKAKLAGAEKILATKPPAKEPWEAERWDSAKLGTKVEWVKRVKWTTEEVDARLRLTTTGEAVLESKWKDLSPTVQAKLTGEIAKDYPQRATREEKPVEPPREPRPVEPPKVEAEKEAPSVVERAVGEVFDVEQARVIGEKFSIGEATPFDPHLQGSKLPPPREGLDVDLMAATKQIHATARYDPLRRMKALGVFTASTEAAKQKIATKDVRWTTTLAHELGHAIDFELAQGNVRAFMGGKIKEKLPTLEISEKEARAELMAASEIIRPLGEVKWSDTKTSAIKYRRRATELLADLFALYVHDPARARKVAPKTTAAFETEIASRPKLQAVLDMVMKPLSVEMPKVSLAGSGAKTPRDWGDKITGSMDDPAARATVDELRLFTKREMEVAGFRTSREAAAWEKILPKVKDREDVGALVEGIGNLRTGESYESIKARMTPEMEKVLREYQHKHELARQEVNKLAEMYVGDKEFIQFLDDHLPHYYKGPRKSIRQFATRWSTRTPHTKKRILPTLQDAVEAGLEPITQDVAYLYQKSAELNYKAALTQGFIKQLRQLKHGITGELLVVASLDKAGPDWVRIEHPAMRRVFARKGKAGKLHLWHNFAYVHPAIARSVKALLDSPFTTNWAKWATAISATGKMLNVGWSGFHGFTLAESAGATLAKGINPMRGFVVGANESRKLGFGFKPVKTWRAGHKIVETDPLGVEDLLRHGLTRGRSASADYFRTEIERGLKCAEDLAAKLPGLKYGPMAARRSFEMINRQLWDNAHFGWKVFSAHQIIAEELALAPKDMSVKQVKETVCKHVNNAFGGQEEIKVPVFRRSPEGKQTVGWEPATPKEMQVFRWLMFAPDWTYSNLAIAGEPLGGRNKLVRKLGRRYWRNMGLQMTAGLAAVQRSMYPFAQAMGDDDYKKTPWENEPGRHWDLDITPIHRAMPWYDPEDKVRRYARPFKQAKEVWGWLEHPRKTLGAKLGFVPRILLEQFMGQSPGSDFLLPWHPEAKNLEGWANLEARAKKLGSNFVPFSWQPNNFAFVLPKRKGMTRWRGGKYFQQAFEAHANPSLFERATQDLPGFHKAIKDAVQEVSNAMKANGYDDEQIKKTYQWARSAVRAKYYDKLFYAIDRKNVKGAKEAARILGTLGATKRTTTASAKRRGRGEGVLPSEVIKALEVPFKKRIPASKEEKELSFLERIRQRKKGRSGRTEATLPAGIFEGLLPRDAFETLPIARRKLA